MLTVFTLAVLLKSYKFFVFSFFNLHEARHVPAPEAVVRRRPYRYDVFPLEQLIVTFHGDLVGSGYQAQIVMVVELVDYLCPKHPSYASGVILPAIYFFRIRPHQITKNSFSRDFLLSINFSDLIEGFDIRGKPTMNTKDVILMTNAVLSTMADIGR